MVPPTIKRTYSSRQNRNPYPSSPISSLSSSPAPATRKRPFEEYSTNASIQPLKRARTSEKQKAGETGKKAQKTLTQLHFCIDQTILRTCPICGLSYTKGAPDDEALHRAQCARVQRGMEWGREEEKEVTKHSVVEVRGGIRLKDGSKGRIICFRADVGGKIGSKVSTLLQTISLALSSPPLTPMTLQASKIYLFLLPPLTSTSRRERIAGCVIAERISSAMRIASAAECATALEQSHLYDGKLPSTPTASLVAVDTGTGLFCHPDPLPTPMGIPRLFVPTAHRRQGIASELLSAAAETFIHGCPLNPQKGQVAFTQPTGDGNAVMRMWGGGGVRIYEE